MLLISFTERLERLEAKVDTIIDHFGAPKLKKGSNLSAEQFRLFGAAQYKALDYELYTVPEEVTNLIDAYVRKSTVLLGENKVGEEDFVQPRSMILCKALFAVVLPEIFDELSFCQKGDSTEYTNYSTILMAAGETEAYLIAGQTDISVVYMGKCIMVWEDKNLNLQLFAGYKPRSQVLAEVKAMNQKIHESLLRYPPRFCGVLTNGIDWSIAQSVLTDGRQLLFISEPCTGVLAHKLIAFCIDQAGVVARFIAARTSLLVKPLIIGEFDDQDPDDVAPEDDNGDIGPARKALSNLSIGASLRGRSTGGAGGARSSSSKDKTSSSSKGKTSGSEKKNIISDHNHYLQMNSENLLNHRMSTGMLFHRCV